jgi:hypothetical protein
LEVRLELISCALYILGVKSAITIMNTDLIAVYKISWKDRLEMRRLIIKTLYSHQKDIIEIRVRLRQ